jgi:hypothetical protein
MNTPRWVNYYLTDDKQWKLSPCFDPDNLQRNLSEFPDPSKIKYKERDTVFINKNETKLTCTIQGIYCQYIFTSPELGWNVFYDLKWSGTGHTHGWFKEEELIQE